MFCRSADVATPSRFPGKVVHLVEAGAPPFVFPPDRINFQRDFLHHGAMPVLDDADRHALDATFAATWKVMRSRFENQPPFCLPRNAALERMGLPRDRRIVALPLEYEHEEAFTGIHNRFARNLDLIDHVADALNDDCVLAITDHPLNYRHIDNRPVHAAIKALGHRAHLVPNADARYWPTTLLIRHCDGLVVRDTKALYVGAFFGKPALRLSHRPTADWIGAHDDIVPFLGDVRAGNGLRSRLYLTSTDFAPEGRETLRAPFVPLRNDNNDLLMQRFLSESFVLEEVLFLSALNVARQVARARGRRQTVYMVGFDFRPDAGASEAINHDYAPGNSADRFFRISMQEFFFLNCLSEPIEGGGTRRAFSFMAGQVLGFADLLGDLGSPSLKLSVTGIELTKYKASGPGVRDGEPPQWPDSLNKALRSALGKLQ